MRPFLQQVADHYFDAGAIGERTLIFPNRRAMVFFSHYLRQAVADPVRNAAVHGGAVRPVLMPRMLTVNDFFYRVCDMAQTDRVSLLLVLYEAYKALNPEAEPLDDFIFWGDVLLADFDDVDKYLVPAERLFTNVADFRGLQDSFEYLTEEQRRAVERFVDHFRRETPVKTRFLRLWNLLCPLYRDFRKRLSDRGMAYEGMVYRRLAERLSTESVSDVLAGQLPGSDRFVFVGLNALSVCERRVMCRMRDAGLAEFCWDYGPGEKISDPFNRASVFMTQNLSDFPQAFAVEGETPGAQVEVISVPSSVGQAKQLPAILREIASESAGGDLSRVGRLDGGGTDCAIVLPDETLLAPVLNSIPPEVADINVTMGFPMGGSAFYGMMSDVASLQVHLRCQRGEWMFYHRQVWSLLSSSLLRKVLSEEDLAAIAGIRSAARYYIPASAFPDGSLLQTLFRPVIRDLSADDPAAIQAFGDYLLTVIEAVAPLLGTDPDLAPEVEFARRYHACVSRLREIPLAVRPQTYLRLLEQLLSAESVPYSGEPLRGLQVMGPLETRALDFTHLVVLSCNEGVFPRRSVSSSFIPPELRKGFGLPTYEYQDAVWAYYFYRMIRRARRVWLLFDARSEKLRAGEESRFVKQLQYHFRVPLRRSVASARICLPVENRAIPKPPDIADRLARTTLSATALQSYLTCQARFFYSYVEGLRAEQEVAESLDAGMIGTVYHACMQALYLGPPAMDPSFPMERRDLRTAISEGRIVPLAEVTLAYIEEWLRRKDDIRARIRSLICAALRTPEVTGRNLVFERVILAYVLQTLSADRKLLLDAGKDRFRILGLELPREWTWGGMRFFGFIDRMDSMEDGVIRIADYKSGKVSDVEVRIDDGNAEAVAEALFRPDNPDRPKIALQLFLYDMFAAPGPGETVQNVIYPAARLFREPPLSARMSPVFVEAVKQRLTDLLAQMADPSVPFLRTEDGAACQWCDFKMICGR